MAKKKVAIKRQRAPKMPPQVSRQQAGPELTAYVVSSLDKMPLQPASSSRQWMDETPERYAYRCLPLVIANQHGWVIPNPVSFTARWNGGASPTDLKIRRAKGSKIDNVDSHFGSGVFTFKLPYLFRTPPGINLWVKGPSNWVKDGVQALEGIVETDWLDSTFTMNWRVTRRNFTVKFEEGEPLCMVVPVPRGLLESLHPVCRTLGENPALEASYQEWSAARSKFNAGLLANDPVFTEQGWQRDYMLGRRTDGSKFEDHQTKLQLRPFLPPSSQ